MILFGLKNCDTCRKARRALEATGHPVTFRDVRAEPMSGEDLSRFLGAFGEEALINRRSTTWRGLSEDERAAPPADLLAAHPALMKRPVIDAGGDLYLGWGPEVQAALL
ncbi:ArsC/Spx/MgsR family protein [Rhodovulum adriaticum]|uniref:Spx/MgsR family transcriptional regulator n=1 Tax=Rhodovulum adriaticum TaxID=35804 RepID=A0A4R2NW45_RHOAD|nr:ArsC/Spx/MgsR family protein [Rhodovulum adriaticum]MBK1635228.1 arsenate reductase [Rhodovulum adriaticum]TCP26363.1 Spx/MgsR family transcriptional regulator [Rhodovulum adriaticum]